MKTPLVSVVIPVYNYERYIAAAIDSVLAQTLTDWELIVVDDHSNDDTPNIARSYLYDNKIKFIRNDGNSGQFATHNRGASLAEGKYIKILHGDDFMFPRFLEITIAMMEAYPGAGLGITNRDVHCVVPKLLTPLDAWRLHISGKSTLFSQAPSGTIMLTEAFRQTSGYDQRFFGSSDVALNLTLAMDYPIVILPDGLWWYRHHDKQISTRTVLRDNGPLEAAVWYRELLDNPANPLPLCERQAAKRHFTKNEICLCLYHANHLRIRRAVKIWRGVGLTISSIASVCQKRNFAEQPNFSANGEISWNCFPGKVPPTDKRPNTDKNCNPTVSVLIPAYNAEKFIGATIESVLAQRYDDWELVIVDDCSTDRTLEIAQSYSDGNRIRCCCNDRHLGKWPNHNRCAEFARGKYLKFLHADDLVYPHCLETMTSLMVNNPEAGLGISGACGPYRAGVCLESATAVRSEFLGSPRFLEGPTALIIRKDTFGKIGGFDRLIFPSERHLQLKIANVLPVVLINPGLIHYRRYAVRTYLGEEKWGLGWAQGYEWLIDWLKSDESLLGDNEVEHAIANLLRYAWKSRRRTKLSFRQRLRIIKCARGREIPLRELLNEPPFLRTGWSQNMRDETLEITNAIPDWSTLGRVAPRCQRH